MSTYPTLRLGVLQALIELKQRMEQQEDLFTVQECPYDKETIAALGVIFKTRVVEKIVEKEVAQIVEVKRGRPTKEASLSDEDQQTVEDTAKDLITQLNALGNGEKGLDTQTKIQIIKTKAVLIEQLLKIRERWFNVKRVAMFQSTVISILGDLLSEDDRTEFMKRLEPYLE